MNTDHGVSDFQIAAMQRAPLDVEVSFSAWHHRRYRQFPAAWEAVVSPWLRTQSARAFEPGERWLAVADSAMAAGVKAAAVRDGLPLLGVAVLTPGLLRKRLMQRADVQAIAATREDLQFLAHLAAAQVGDARVGRAVRLDPGVAVRAFDAAAHAGCSEAGFAPVFRPVIRALERYLALTGLRTTAAIDRALADAEPGPGAPPLSLLLLGFGPRHGHLLPLLEACGQLATDGCLCVPEVTQPRHATVIASTLEARFGPAEAVCAEPDEALDAAERRGDAFEAGTGPAAVDNEAVAAGGAPPLTVAAAADVEAEATMAVDAALTALEQRTGSEPVAIAVSSIAAPIARATAARLEALGLPHLDGPGHPPGRDPGQQALEAWITWQQTQQLDDFANYLEVCANHGGLAPATARGMRQQLDAAAGETLDTRLAVIFAALERSENAASAQTASRATGVTGDGGVARNTAAAADWRRRHPLLPEVATFGDFLDASLAACATTGWPRSPQLIAERAAPLRRAALGSVPRDAFLQWFAEVVRVPGRSRQEAGRQPFSGLYLLPVSEATAQTWSALVLAGMQAMEWPPPAPGNPFLPARRITAWNTEALQPGPHGEGEPVLRPGRTMVLSPADEEALFAEEVRQLLSATRGPVTATFSLDNGRDETSEGQPAAHWQRLHHLRHGHAADRDTYLAMARQWDQRQPPPQADGTDFTHLRDTWRERRNPSRPFSAHSYALEAPVPPGFALSCKAWETARKTPATAWYRHVLKVDPRETLSADAVLARTSGTWLHQWISANLSATPQPVPTAEVWAAAIDGAAEAAKAHLGAVSGLVGQAVPDWVLAALADRRREARALATELASAAAGDFISVEWPLPDAEPLPLPDGTPLHRRGRIDALVTDRAAWLDGGARLWVIDYKTGAQKALSAREIPRGTGLQVALYAQFLQVLAAPEELSASVISPSAKVGPQMAIAEILGFEEVWTWLASVQSTGVFGDRETQNQPERRQQYPLACLPIPPDLLNRRWATHWQTAADEPEALET